MKGTFLPGNPGGGRPKGSKSKFSKAVIQTYAQHVANGDFQNAMETLKTDNPAVFAKLVNDAGLKMMEREDKGQEGTITQVALHVHFIDPGTESARPDGDTHTNPDSVSGALPAP